MYKKIFLSLFIFLGFLLCIDINCSFATFSFSYNGTDYNIPDLPTDEPDYLITISPTSGRVYLILFDNNIVKPTRWYSSNTGFQFTLREENTSTSMYCYYIEPNSSNWVFKNSYSLPLPNGSMGTAFNFAFDAPICSASCNIYDFYSDEILFLSAPLGEEQTTLNTIATSMDFSQVLMEVLVMLPILLVILISYLSLRKAIKILFRILGNA